MSYYVKLILDFNSIYRYDTEFFILHRYPLAVRLFYTMPCSDDQNYSTSFDVFIRGKNTQQVIYLCNALIWHSGGGGVMSCSTVMLLQMY